MKLISLVFLSFVLCIAYTQINRCACPNEQYYEPSTNTCEDPPNPIDNCKKYVKWGQNAKCTQCNKNYRLSGQQCLETHLRHCNIAHPNGQVCTDCTDGYYLIRGLCVKNPDDDEPGYVDGCSKYHYTNQPLCLECDDDDDFLDQNQCVDKDDKIENCTTIRKWGANYRCELCNDGYYINRTWTCSENPSDGDDGYADNCKQYHQAGAQVKCLVCEDDYALQAFQCVEVPNPIDNCSEYITWGANYLCKQCDPNNWVAARVGGRPSQCIECPWSGASVLSMSALLFLAVALLI